MTLTSFDRDGKTDGELSTTVPVRRPGPRRAPDDYSRPDEQVAVGC